MYDGLVEAEKDGIQSDITGLRGIPFRLINTSKPNKYGIVQYMLFEQEAENINN